MRERSSRRTGRHGQPRVVEVDLARPRSDPRGVDVTAVAKAVARAAARSRAHGDANIAIGAILSNALPDLSADFALALNADGQVIASAATSAAGLRHAARDHDALLEVGEAALASLTEAHEGDNISAFPLMEGDAVLGALVLLTDSGLERASFAAASRLLADCLADMMDAPAPTKPALPKQAPRDRHEISDRLIKALAAHGDGVALFGRDRGLIAANPAFASAHDATVEALRGLTLEDILRRNHDGIGPLWLGRDVSSSGRSGVELALAADGRWLRLARHRSPNGDEVILQSLADEAVARMAELRRRALSVEQASEARALIWEGIPVGAILLSNTDRIVDVNPEATRLLRAERPDLIGRRLGRLAENATTQWTPAGRARAGGGPLAIKASRLSDGRTLLVLTELPEALEVEEAPGDRLEAKQALTATRALGEFGHEMRTPLNAVIGFAEVMLARSFGPVNERQGQYLQDIARAGRHMLEMVEHMLDHEQLTTGKYPFQPQWCRLRSLATEATRFLELPANDGELQLIMAPMEDIEVYVDRRGLLQVLINLLSNAVKFTPPGGQVELSATAQEDGLYIAIRDTGEGIPEEDLGQVMEPFTQARRLGAKPLKGAGLGLSIVQALTELHGGSLGIASVLGEGTTITLKLPAERMRLSQSTRGR